MPIFRSLFRNRPKMTHLDNIEANTSLKNSTSSTLSDNPGKSNSTEEFLDYWIQKALKMGASDIHFECYREYVKVRYRIDGKLQIIKNLPINLHSSLVTYIKILSKLKIDEKRVPQDGRFSFVHEGQKFDVRVSILPGYFGECIVMRLLCNDDENFSLQKLGIREKDICKLENLVLAQNGIVIVAGPTGSGKSTTLYSIIKKISSPERKVITVEDPVEYQLEGINQVSINESIGMTFATALRSILRQAPNIILVGEIRDKETAEIAIRAALTGHLVLSTVHARDTVNAITRLFDLGIPTYLIAATLRGVLSQRLIPKLCPFCVKKGNPDLELLKDLAPEYAMGNEICISEPGNCGQCFGTGYKGRQAIMEILPITEIIQKMIDQKFDEDSIRKQAQMEGMETLRQVTLAYYTYGKISHEVLLAFLNEMS